MSENPYAPPVAPIEIPDAPRSHGWQVRGNYVLVQEGAVLPMIDPYTGLSADSMAMYRVKLKQIRSFALVIVQRTVSFRIFITPETTRRNKIEYLFSALRALCGFSFFILPRFEPFASNLAATYITLLIIIFLLVIKRSTQRRLICKNRLGPEFEIRGFHPSAITELQKIQSRVGRG